MQRLPLLFGLVCLGVACSAAPTAAPTGTPEPLTIRIAYNSALDIDDIPSLLAQERLTEAGYVFAVTAYSKPELAVEALAQGEADFDLGASRTAWAAIRQGAAITAVMEQVANNYSILAVNDIETCADLAGRRFGINSAGSLTSAMADVYLKQTCPGTEPEFVVITDSTARAAAMLSGTLDATPLTLADALDINASAPGKFHSLINFADALPDLVIKVVSVNQDFARQHPAAVEAFLTAMVQAHRDIKATPSLAIEVGQTKLDVNDSILPDVIAAYVAGGAWDINGGLDEAAVQYSVSFYTDTGNLEPGLSVAQAADFSFLTTALETLGRQ